MSIKDQIEQDFIGAYKAREEARVSLLRLLKSAIKNAEIETGKSLSDDDIVKILFKEIKQREDSITEYTKVDRNESAKKEQDEINLIKFYLPSQLDTTEIEKIVDKIIAETKADGLKDMGKVMNQVMSVIGSKANGSAVSAIVKNKLSA